MNEYDIPIKIYKNGAFSHETKCPYDAESRVSSIIGEFLLRGENLGGLVDEVVISIDERNVPNPEKRDDYKWYWMGKQPSTRKKVESCIVLYRKENTPSLRKMARIHGITEGTLRFHLRELSSRGLYGLTSHILENKSSFF